MSFSAYLADLPRIHSWDGGRTWNTGGFDAGQLRRIHGAVAERFGDRPPSIIETGAGNSTITFLHLGPRRLVSIAPESELRDRIDASCAAVGVDTAPLDYRVGRSERVLPELAQAGERFDVALIDGGHGWPTVFVDFCYINMMMGKGGLVLVDDLQLYSVGELARLLEQEPGYERVLDLGKVQGFAKRNDAPFLPGHSLQPYLVEQTTRRSSRWRNPRRLLARARAAVG